MAKTSSEAVEQPQEAAPSRRNRICDVCGAYDDHPRHVVGFGPDEVPAPDREVLKKLAKNVDFTTDEGSEAVADFYDTTIQLRHMDCCREVGCPDGTCNVVTRGAEDLRGSDLLAHIEKTNGGNK